MEWKWSYILRGEDVDSASAFVGRGLKPESSMGKENTIHFSQESVWKSFYEASRLI